MPCMRDVLACVWARVLEGRCEGYAFRLPSYHPLQSSDDSCSRPPPGSRPGTRACYPLGCTASRPILVAWNQRRASACRPRPDPLCSAYSARRTARRRASSLTPGMEVCFICSGSMLHLHGGRPAGELGLSLRQPSDAPSVPGRAHIQDAAGRVS